MCLDCIRSRPKDVLAIADDAHRSFRHLFGLSEHPPHSECGHRCRLCVQDCVIGEGERGYCGLRKVPADESGKLRHLASTLQRGLLHWYRDPLPTNCVADPFCAGHSQRGKQNLAVFYESCTCVCYFGGGPASQMPHSLAAGYPLAERGIVICWETNGTARPRLMERALDLSLSTGGCVKFDLKAYADYLHRALAGVGNRRTLENFAVAAERSTGRSSPPPVIASASSEWRLEGKRTLLVPGYVDAEDIGHIARFIGDLNPDIPYVLLGFAPHFLFPDLPRTSVRHAEAAEATARATGLRNVRVGNRHLLSPAY